MITKIVDHEPVNVPANAEEILASVQLLFDSANRCVVTAFLKRCEPHRDYDCRIGVSYAWTYVPSTKEEADAQQHVDSVFGAPIFLVSSNTSAESVSVHERWLGSGEVPNV